MFPLRSFSLYLLFSIQVTAQITLTGTDEASTVIDIPSASYVSYGSTIIIASDSSASSGNVNAVSASVAVENASTTSTSSNSVTYLTGHQNSSSTLSESHSGNATASSTSSSAQPTNTTPCNGYTEFCNRKYSNITMVAAHNSPFVRLHNAASNQMLDVTTQLSDGIRMLQSESHYVNNTIYLCHTSCNILNAGTLEAYLTTVVSWLAANPYEVITILLVNSDYVDPGNYTAPVRNSGLIDYVYTPPQIPMGIDDWPTLGEMILTGKRAVMMLDYQANQTAIPWLLDEFGQMWETPFSPTNASFPCTAQRPPASAAGALPRPNRMYLANHNLNVDLSIAGFSLLTPAYGFLNDTNSDLIQYGALGAMATNCTHMWDRPPNFLLVDYYNLGNFNGSVFQVAADANGVSYDRSSCCGSVSSGALSITRRRGGGGGGRELLTTCLVSAILVAISLG